MAKKLLTVAEAASILRVTNSRVYELLRQNVVPGRIQLGRQIRISHAALETFLERGGKGLEPSKIQSMKHTSGRPSKREQREGPTRSKAFHIVKGIDAMQGVV